jgi:hypothetical protein
MRRVVAQNIAVLSITVALLLLAGEISVRVISHTDTDNNTVIRGKILRPYKFPLHAAKNSMDFYVNNVNKNPSKVRYVYDKFLGWNSNPNMSDHYNEQAILGPNKTFTEKPKDDILRIALFGDSMTRSSGAGVEKSWSYLLEKNLTELGYQVEVMNFGVGDYGIDQIYLRWEIEGKKYSPHVVIFGFYPLDIARCLEVHKLKNWGLVGGIVFSKPRFLIDNDDNLKIINSHTMSPDKMLDNVKSFDDLPYIEHDLIYQDNKGDYKKSFWRNSYLLGFIEANLVYNRFTQAIYDKDSIYYNMKNEGAQLALKIIQLFHHSSQENKSDFYTVILPSNSDLFHFKNGKPLRYMHIINMIEKFSPVIHTEKVMKDYDIEQLYLPNDGHFSAFGNEVVAKILSEYLTKNTRQLRNGKKKDRVFTQPFEKDS